MHSRTATNGALVSDDDASAADVRALAVDVPSSSFASPVSLSSSSRAATTSLIRSRAQMWSETTVAVSKC